MMQAWMSLILGGLLAGLPALAIAWMYRRHMLRQAEHIREQTAQHQAAEKAWRESESHFRMLAEHSPDVISRLDLEGRILYVSSACRILLGYEPQELIGSLAFELSCPEDLPLLHQTHQDGLIHHEQRMLECRLRRKDGRMIWVETTIQPVFDQAGALREVYTASRDLTQRKMAEQALRESENRYRQLVERLPESLAVLVGGRIVMANRAGMAMVGRDRYEDVQGQSPVQFVAPEDRALAQSLLDKAEHEGIFPPPTLVRVMRPDGSKLLTQSYLLPMQYEGQSALLLLTRDVTELVAAQNQLEEHQRLLATLMGNLPGMAYRCRNDAQWTMLYVSPGCRELTGYDSQQLLEGRMISFNQLIHPEDRAMVWGTIQKSLARSEAFQVYFRLQSASGDWKWVWEHGQGVLNEQGQLAYIEGFVLDVTQRRQVQEALRESEERFRQLVEHIDAIFWLQDTQNNRLVYVSPAYEKIMGRSASAVLDNRELYLQYVHPEDRDKYLQWDRGQTRDKPQGEGIEYRIQRPDGQDRWLRTMAFPVYDRKGQVVRLAGMSRDVTEWRQTLADLRLSQDRYSNAIVAGRMALWSVDLKTGKLDADFMLQRLLTGVDDAPDPLVDPWFDFVDPQHLPRVREAWLDCVNNRSERFDVDFPTRPLTGPSRWLQVRAHQIRDPQGNLLQVVGVSTDISDRHQVEEALRQSEEHYRQLAQSNRRLLNEVNHRVRNNLASLLGLITLSRRRAASVEAFAQAMHDRIMAMSQTHNMLIESGWHDLNLRSLLMNLLSSMQRSAPHHIDLSIQGPSVPVNPRQTLPLTMAITELFTNSCKYGAHRSPQGRIAIHWTCQDESPGAMRVRLNWKETGGPVIPQPVVPSLGTELMQGFVKFELGGTLSLNYPPQGADHWIEFTAEFTPAGSASIDPD